MKPERWFYTVPLRLRSLFRREETDRELDDELRDHVEQKVKELASRGMTQEEARRSALLEIGGVERRKEECRETRRANLVHDALQDLHYAARTLRKSPGFAAVAVLTIALGIGATTSIFSVVDATLLNPLPYPHPEQLVSIVDDLPGVGAHEVGMSVPEWHDLERSGVFQYVSPMGGGASVNLTGSSQPTRAQFNAIPPNYFALLGVKPLLGRTFNPEDHTPGFNLETVIGEGLWKRAFGGDPGILGRSIRLDNDLYRIVGVIPAGFHDPGRTTEERKTEVWAAAGFAAAPAPEPLRKAHFLVEAIGRLKSGLTVAQAQSHIDALVASLQKQFPDDYPAQNAWTVRLVPLKDSLFGNSRESLIVLLGAVGLVLLIGCVNVANLLLARASARGREMALRQALGATRKRLVRQLLTESLLLSLLGGILGLMILFCTKGLLLQLVPDTLPRVSDISVNWTTWLFALAASIGAGVIFGLAPALHVGRVDLTQALKLESRGAGGPGGSGEQARTRRVLVVTEFALSLVLMIAAGLLLRSFWDLLRTQLGFNPEEVVAVQTWLPIPNDPKTDIYRTAAQETPFVREVLRRVKTLPGAEEVAVGDLAALPLGHTRNDLRRFPLIFEGRESPIDQAPLVYASIVTPDYFRVLGMRLLRGRSFSDADIDTAPRVALVNESFVQTFWPNQEAVGQRFKMPSPEGGPNFEWVTVAGVLTDVRTESPEQGAHPQLYLSLYQRTAKDLVIFLRGHLDTAAVQEDVREQVQAVDSELPVFGARTLNEVVSGAFSERRFSMELVGTFALTALLLAALGIYGVISYMVGERTHEIGIRMALGAQRGAILQMVLRQGLGLAMSGAAAGLACALVASRLMAGMLYGVRPTDPATFAGVAVLLIAVALLACYIPARRAVGIDPLVAIRYE